MRTRTSHLNQIGRNFSQAIFTEHAPDTEKMLRERGVSISAPVQKFGSSYFGSFLDSEGDKLWFCSSAPA